MDMAQGGNELATQSGKAFLGKRSLDDCVDDESTKILKALKAQVASLRNQIKQGKRNKKGGNHGAAPQEKENEESFVGIILGLPLNMNGTEGPRCQSTRSFAKKLSQITNHHICLWDERLSTIAAEKSLISSDISRKSRSQIIDKIAACYILQGFLNRLKNL